MIEMSKQDRIRSIISWAQEAYELASHPPAQDYGRKVDPTAAQSRHHLLMIGIDIKHAVHDYLQTLNETRATTLSTWLVDNTNLFHHSLTEYQQIILKSDIRTLKLILLDKSYK